MPDNLPPPQTRSDVPGRAELILRREVGNTAKIRSFKILADDTNVGTIKEAQTENLFIAAGRHRLRLKCAWCSSPEVVVDLVETGPTTLTCRTASSANWNSLFRRNRFIDLVPSAESLAAQRPFRQEVAIRMSTCLIGLLTIVVVLAVTGAGAITGNCDRNCVWPIGDDRASAISATPTAFEKCSQIRPRVGAASRRLRASARPT